MSAAPSDLVPAQDGPPRLSFAGPRATITLCRPSQHNRIDPADVGTIMAHLDSVERRADARMLVLTGSGEKTFCSGYTIDAIRSQLDERFEGMLDRIEALPMPTLCALTGSVYGGGTDLALCCDFRIGVRDIRMFMPAARFGLHFYPGGLRRFVARIGPGAAKKLFLTAQSIEAEEMLRVGYLTELVARASLADAVNAYEAAIFECEPGVVASMKRQIDGLAAGNWGKLDGNDAYRASLGSEELSKRLENLG